MPLFQHTITIRNSQTYLETTADLIIGREVHQICSLDFKAPPYTGVPEVCLLCVYVCVKKYKKTFFTRSFCVSSSWKSFALNLHPTRSFIYVVPVLLNFLIGKGNTRSFQCLPASPTLFFFSF